MKERRRSGFGAAHGMDSHDHPLPSGCAFSLRIDGRQEGGDGAPRPPRPPDAPPPRGSTAREDKESLSAPRQPSLRTAARERKVGESLSSPCALPRAAAAAAARASAGRARRETGGLNPPSLSAPRQPSLRTAVHGKPVEDAACSTGSGSPPRSAARRERCRLCPRRAPHSWLTGA